MKGVVFSVLFLLFIVVGLAVVVVSIRNVFLKQGHSISDSSVGDSDEKTEGVPNERERLATFAINLILGAFGVVVCLGVIFGMFGGLVALVIKFIKTCGF